MAVLSLCRDCQSGVCAFLMVTFCVLNQVISRYAAVCFWVVGILCLACCHGMLSAGSPWLLLSFRSSGSGVKGGGG